MRSLAILWLLAAGACGGGAARPEAPAGSQPGPTIVKLVERAADEVCLCGDGLCADDAVERLRDGLRGRDDTMLTTQEQATMVRAVARLDRCRARLFSRGEQAARVAERWAHETCACADAECRAAASQRGAAELRRYGDAEASDEELRRIVVASRRVRGCLRDDERVTR